LLELTTLKADLNSDLIDKFNIAVSLRGENQNSVLSELISQYIEFAFKTEALNARQTSVRSPRKISSDKVIYKAKKNNIGQTDQIRSYIMNILYSARQDGLEYIEIRSGNIHRDMGLINRIPSVCAAMETLEVFDKYEIVHDTHSKRSSTRIFKYYLKIE
jgi:hypothetical protein